MNKPLKQHIQQHCLTSPVTKYQFLQISSSEIRRTGRRNKSSPRLRAAAHRLCSRCNAVLRRRRASPNQREDFVHNEKLRRRIQSCRRWKRSRFELCCGTNKQRLTDCHMWLMEWLNEVHLTVQNKRPLMVNLRSIQQYIHITVVLQAIPNVNDLGSAGQRWRRRDWHQDREDMEENLPHGLSQRASLQGNIPRCLHRQAKAGLGSARRAAVGFLHRPASLSINHSARSKWCHLWSHALDKPWSMWYCFNQNILVDLNEECERHKMIYSHFKPHVCRSENNQVMYEKTDGSLVPHRQVIYDERSDAKDTTTRPSWSSVDWIKG